MFGRVKKKYVILFAVVAFYLIGDQSGLFLMLRARDFYTEFFYPIEGNVPELAADLKAGHVPKIKPINKHDYTMVKKAKGKCLEEDGVHYHSLRLVYLVKSAINHFDRRAVIRKTWGFERRFSDVGIRTVFLLASRGQDAELQLAVENEAREHGDIVQGDFEDTYFNNTLKAMMGLRWAVEQCPTSRFYMFVDDDYYVSTRNVLRFLRNPVNYPRYLTDPVVSFDDEDGVGHQSRQLKQMVDFDLPDDVKLYAGYTIQSRPLRQPLSRWFVDLDEYPFHLWPRYVTAGAYILSRDALQDLYYGSYFVKRFRFDDIFLALVAMKMELERFHSDEFHFDRKTYSVLGYRYVVASHGFSNPAELERTWNQQKQAGNA